MNSFPMLFFQNNMHLSKYVQFLRIGGSLKPENQFIVLNRQTTHNKMCFHVKLNSRAMKIEIFHTTFPADT